MVKLVYYGLTTGRGNPIQPFRGLPTNWEVRIATQTLGEEYTDIWQYSSRRGQLPPSLNRRAALIFLSVLPTYILAKLGSNASLNQRHPDLANWLRKVQKVLSVSTEINMTVFYLRGRYYDPMKRVLGIQQVGSMLFR